MKAKRMDEIEELIATARKELNPSGADALSGKVEGHPLWGPVACALSEAVNEVYRLKAQLNEIAKTVTREVG